MDSKKPYDTMTGAEFNVQMAGIQMYKVLNYDLVHHDYKYVPGALNQLNSFREQFDPDPDCKPGGLYFCAESDILRWVNCVTLIPAPLIVRVEIPDDARISIGEYKFKTDKLILGQPVTFDKFFSDEYISNMGVDYFNADCWRKRIVWQIMKKQYLLNPIKFDDVSHHKTKLMIYAVQNADIEFLDLMLGNRDIQKIMAHRPYDNIVLNLLGSTLPPLDSVIEWFGTHFPQHALIDVFKRPRGSMLPGYYTN